MKVLEAAVEEAKELMEAERDHLAEKSLDELDELEVCTNEHPDILFVVKQRCKSAAG